MYNGCRKQFYRIARVATEQTSQTFYTYKGYLVLRDLFSRSLCDTEYLWFKKQIYAIWNALFYHEQLNTTDDEIVFTVK
jgi:hypothetical protein